MTQSILQTIAQHTQKLVHEAKAERSLEALKEAALARSQAMPSRFAFSRALRAPGLSFICEVKKASPSKGVISEDFPYRDIAADYEAAGAECLSCLTEPKWFLGSDEIFAEIRETVSLPMIRKDFIVDEYQIYQSKLLGADAVLLICALLPEATLARYLEIARSLGLDALTETHNEAEVRSALSAGADIIGVNNRNLKDFTVDFSNAARLRDLIPSDKIYVAESGARNEDDIRTIAGFGANAVLIGESLMRAENRRAFLASLKAAARSTEGDATAARDTPPGAPEETPQGARHV